MSHPNGPLRLLHAHTLREASMTLALMQGLVQRSRCSWLVYWHFNNGIIWLKLSEKTNVTQCLCSSAYLPLMTTNTYPLVPPLDSYSTHRSGRARVAGTRCNAEGQFP